MQIEADDQKLPQVVGFIKSCLPANLSLECLNKIELVTEEIFVNISHYAYDGGAGEAQIECELYEPGKFRLSFIDWGKEFNPLEQEEPDLTLSIEERRLGGFGIFLTKKFMDSVSYKRQDGKNILTLVKTFG